MPRTASVQLPADVLKERSTAYQAAYQAIQDAIECDVDNELVDSAFLHPLSRARDYVGKEAGKMARMTKNAEREASKNAQTQTPTAPTPNGASSEKPATAGSKS